MTPCPLLKVSCCSTGGTKDHQSVVVAVAAVLADAAILAVVAVLANVAVYASGIAVESCSPFCYFYHRMLLKSIVN